jgi:cyclopropane fatty-acyl-phospholipid synthase-like methyltransferase
MGGSTKEHWDGIYSSKEVEALAWYEESPEQCLEMIARSGVAKDEPILDVGVGASTLIDALVEQGHSDIIGVDLSQVALDALRSRLGEGSKRTVRLMVDDITRPSAMLEVGPIAIWHDRALLHFLLEDEMVQAYFDTLRRMVREGGYAIIAVFSLEGAKMCSGLDLRNYSARMIDDLLGDDFEMVHQFDYVYTTPGGASKPYIYTLSKRKGSS